MAVRFGLLGAGRIGKVYARAVTASGDGYARPPLHDFFMTRHTGAYANEIASFIASIEKGTPLSRSGADGLAALVLADAALRSVFGRSRKSARSP